MIAAAKALGAKSAKLVKYQTSGDVTGDKSSVVGYAGIILT
jgi:AmmeMemoRadiSam system protein B